MEVGTTERAADENGDAGPFERVREPLFRKARAQGASAAASAKRRQRAKDAEKGRKNVYVTCKSEEEAKLVKEAARRLKKGESKAEIAKHVFGVSFDADRPSEAQAARSENEPARRETASVTQLLGTPLGDRLIGGAVVLLAAGIGLGVLLAKIL